MYSMMLGYAAFYCLRLNVIMIIPTMQNELGFSKQEIGSITSSFFLALACAKVCSGFIVDKSSARLFLPLGLLGCALINLGMFFCSNLFLLSVLWGINGIFQSIGWPACTKLLGNWFSPKEMGTKWAISTASHQLGGAIIILLSGVIVRSIGWRYVFLIPAVFCLLLVIFLWNRIRDKPQDVDLPPVEYYKNIEVKEIDITSQSFMSNCIYNPALWSIALGNFFVYVVRVGFLTWAPTFLTEFKGISFSMAGWYSAGFEITGIMGGIIAGRASDKIFEARRSPVSVLFMAILLLCVLAIWLLPAQSYFLSMIIMFLVGFFIQGPQVLAGISATDFVTKEYAGTAVGIIGTLGYLGGTVAGVGVGTLVDKYSWNGAFILFSISVVIGMACFAFTWNKKPIRLR